MLANSKAAFIDRDGVINKDFGYVYRIEDFELIPGVIEALSLLIKNGFLLIIITNQAGLARGYYSYSQLNKLHSYLIKILINSGVNLDAIYFCPHHPNGIVPSLSIECNCRKPAPGLIFRAEKDFNINLNLSVLFGDKMSDIQAGKSAGVGTNFIVNSGQKIWNSSYSEPDYIASNLLEAVKIFCSENKE